MASSIDLDLCPEELKDSINAGEDEDLIIPRASLNKMIKQLAPNVRVATEARELILTICTEFIHHIATEANQICNRQQKKTISPEHALEALVNLGFGGYVEEASAVVEEAREVATTRRKKKKKLEDLGIPEEELLKKQQELFAKARLDMAQMDQIEWQEMQSRLQQQHQLSNPNHHDDYDNEDQEDHQDDYDDDS